MKKYLMMLTLCLFSLPAGAQMGDILGVMAIDQMMDRETYQGVGQMQNALKKNNLRQDLSDLITKTQIAALNGHFDKSDVRFDGLQGIEWNVVSVAVGQYYIELKNLDYSDCFSVKNGQWGEHHIEINDDGSCQYENNTAKLYF